MADYGRAYKGLSVTGNTHFLMSDLTNVETADPIAEWLAGKPLD